jgi:hypothetical protein
MTEAQWFYQEGLRLRQQGDEDAARRVWKALVGAFQEVPSEGPWLELAEQELAKADEKAVERQWGPVRQAVQRARALRQEGKTKEAEAILSALEKLYHRDERAKAILKGD